MRKLKGALIAGALVAAGYVAAQQAEKHDIRRVVTKLDPAGKAVVMIDEQTVLQRPRGPTYVGNLWVTESTPSDYSWNVDRGKTKIGLMPPKGGSVFRVVDFPPEREALDHMGKSTMQDVVGAAGTPAKGMAPRHPLMHRTRTLDYAIIMSGEIDMLVDEGEVHLKAGDVVVQQATNHAWVNRGTQPCRIAFILLDGQEP
jgi:mannose-6-phosphate isomerase-like protein (cupin superfamily)